MQFLRTPDTCFNNLPDFPFKPNYIDIDDGESGKLRMHYLDEGQTSAEIVLLLHGEPSWCFLYRKMIVPLVEAGYRVIAPDLIGFGRSDKPTEPSDYSYQRHMDWLSQFIELMDLQNITLMCQDWGGLLGLRLVAEQPQRFARVCAANTSLPTGDQDLGEAFHKWKAFALTVDPFPAGGIIKGATTTDLTSEVIDGYNAPFPDETYKAGARVFPTLVPASPDDPASAANRRAWELLKTFEKPFLTAFSDSDPVTAGSDRFFQKLIPGTKGQKHTTIQNAGHFLQEDQGLALAKVLIQFIQDNPL